MNKEAEAYAKILGYNYNSSEWYEKSYKILNKNYKIKNNPNKEDSKKNDVEKGFLDKIINIIK